MRQLCFISMAEDPIISSSSLFEVLLFPALSSPFSKHSIVVCSSPSSVAISLVLSRLLPAGTKCGANKAVLPLLPQRTFHYQPQHSFSTRLPQASNLSALHSLWGWKLLGTFDEKICDSSLFGSSVNNLHFVASTGEENRIYTFILKCIMLLRIFGEKVL